MDALASVTARAVMRRLGQDAIYTPLTGVPATIRIILDRDVVPTAGGMQSQMMERRTELTGYTSELGSGKRGDTVTLGAETWRLVQKESDDGHLVTWIVTAQR